MSSPCHVEVVLAEKVESVKKEEEARGPKVSAKQAARLRLQSGSTSAK
jgi:large subunit ribosomal protein L17e